DVSRIEQVIVHMVDNSVDAMPQGGTLTIEVSSTATSAEDAMLLPASLRNEDEPADKYAILTIKDTGCGIAEDIQSRIFEPFFTTKKTKHNVGLGLAMVYKIVEQHDGQITVHSAPGQGATFRIFLPMPA
ncbi:MAG: ATP-binding protein, partial [Kiritimatiellae bacterium]|nr:ATP-binding protein [Kiritimatiellia bacterium]